MQVSYSSGERKRQNGNSSNQKIKCNNRANRTKPNRKLPFFAYGIFKPGEIAYSKIKGMILDKEELVVNYSIKERDGVPILLRKEHEKNRTKGYLFHFTDNEGAYDVINETISDRLYEWGRITVGGDEVNALFGRCPKLGSNYIEDKEAREKYDGRNNLLFKEGIEFIKENLESKSFIEEKGFFELQMNYMLLWSAIDRYCKLKYNSENEYENRLKLSKEDIFYDALQIYADEKNYWTIYSTDNLSERAFDKSKPSYCINYYYTLRCNIVHRGKSSFKDIRLLHNAIRDLLHIFEYILKNTFDDE